MKDKKHACNLDLGSDSMLPKKAGKWNNFLRSIRKLGQVATSHPNTFQQFRSYPAVVAGRQRQLLEEGKHVIHPLSLFSLYWKSLMIVVNLSHMIISSFRLMYILQPRENLQVHTLDVVLLLLNIVCLLDVIFKFNCGYYEGTEPEPVMDRSMIACRYLCRWFVLDVASSLPIAYTMLRLRVRSPRYILAAHLMSLLRISKIYTVMVDVKIFIRIFTTSYIWCGAVRNAMLFLVSVHLCSCLLYMLPVFQYYWQGSIPSQYVHFLNGGRDKNDLLKHDIGTRYNKAIIKSLSAFLSTGFLMFFSTEPEEFLIHSLIIFYGELFMIYNLVFLLKSYLAIYGSAMRYQGLMNEVEEYMKYQQFPLALKKRVLAFYSHQYQGKYFREDTVLKCLSGELNDEIKMHTCHKLVDKVKLFTGIPASVVGTVLGCLQPEVYLPNDLVVSAGDVGDCMYFIATGTVAVYSLKGVEVCHLEDGAYFGEVALLMKDSKRVTTVVAVELTQLYRLDSEPFRRFVVSCHMLHQRIEELAAQRMHETVLLDEAFQRSHELLQQSQRSDSTRRSDNEQKETGYETQTRSDQP